MRRLLVVALMAPMVLVACGGDDDGGGGGGGGTAGVDAYFDGLIRKSCEQIFACCDEAEKASQLSLFDPAPTNVEECITAFAPFIGLAKAQLNLSINSNRARFDAAAATACLAGIDGTDCVDQTADEGCDGVLIGQRATGATCDQDYECAQPGDYCAGEEGAKICAARPGIGEACEFDDCGDANYCDFGSGECAARVADGGACQSDSQCVTEFCDTSGETPVCAVGVSECDGV